MNAHEQLDKFLNSSPKKKALTFLGILAAVAVVLGITFWLGTRKGSEWADSEYLRKRDENLQRATEAEARSKMHQQNAQKLAEENALLRAANEKAAQLQSQKDAARLKEDAGKIEQVLKERDKKYAEIDSTTDDNVQLCAMCAEAARAGHPLSHATCGRCQTNP